MSSPAAGPRRLALRAGDRDCTIAASLVDAVGRLGAVRPVPGAPLAVLGLSEWRGRVVTVIDLAALVGSHEPAPVWIVRLAAPFGHAALAVGSPPALRDAAAGDAVDVAASVAALCGSRSAP